MSGDDSVDAAMRQAAVAQLDRLAAGRPLSSEDLAAGFLFRGERIPLVNPQRGIFKPRVMRHLLSIRTVYPRTGARVWYDDQRRVHDQIHRGEELVDYAFMGTNPDAADNRWLKEAMEAQIPVLYFLGIAPGRYTAIYPSFIAGWSASELIAKIGFGMPIAASATALPPAPERRYALRLVSQRLHQATFREAVLTAYDGRCAISRLPERRLLDAAHIIADGDETLGQPIVANGLPLSKVHHAAFDANLIGIDADYRIHVSEQLFAMNDGPMLEQGIKAMRGKTLLMPGRIIDRPDRDRLAARFEYYQSAN
ncbi:HNH endonuclease [Sphingomonas sp. PAMC 26617]|uniref:HNH endonuclease n=1 Tax=Sphingomonas sp. PAMC 26617 TaxID=1112216 RepID=UPI0002898DD2|nr:HNH endonuclease [Sphingomonas sp. PAMC 26617]